MNLTTKWIWRTTVLSAAVSLSAFGASAARATFNLPVEAHWGSVVLKPGKHTFDVLLASSWPQQISLIENGETVAISALTEWSGVNSGRSYLRLVAVGGTYFVREYSSGPSGKQFTFRIPKPIKAEAGVQTGAVTVPVSRGT